jgi:hypothetical protein
MNRNALTIGVGLTLLAAAVTYHARSMRYEVTHLNPLAIVRTDRLTGRSELCIEHRLGGTMTCAPATDSLR